LKKRSKKLLQIARGTGPKGGNSVRPAPGKSFLVLFFKKERLSFFFFSMACNSLTPLSPLQNARRAVARCSLGLVT
jgi:hypothetical protein